MVKKYLSGIYIGILVTFFCIQVRAQVKNSLTEMPVRDKYSFIAWEMNKKGWLSYEAASLPQYIDFSALLIRDIFPERRQRLMDLLKNNNNEFGTKMFVDSIIQLVKLLEPFPFEKHYIVSCEATLSEYDFKAKRFQVFPDTDQKFLSPSNSLFREVVNLTSDRYKNANNIPIPFYFVNASIPSYNDKYSLYRKGWNYIGMSTDSAQKLVEKVSLNSQPGNKRKIFAQIEYKPVVFENQLIATHVIRVSYYLDAAFENLIVSYSEGKESPNAIKPDVASSPNAGNIFVKEPFIRHLNPINERVRYVVYKGLIESENKQLNGQVCYHAVLFKKFEETGSGKYLQVMALGNGADGIPNAIFWIQVGTANAPLWIEGYKGLQFGENGEYGKKVGFGTEITVKAPQFMDRFEFAVTGIDKQRYSSTLDRLLIVFDKKGNEIAKCTLVPVSGELSTEPISDKLLFLKK